MRKKDDEKEAEQRRAMVKTCSQTTNEGRGMGKWTRSREHKRERKVCEACSIEHREKRERVCMLCEIEWVCAGVVCEKQRHMDTRDRSSRRRHRDTGTESSLVDWCLLRRHLNYSN